MRQETRIGHDSDNPLAHIVTLTVRMRFSSQPQGPAGICKFFVYAVLVLFPITVISAQTPPAPPVSPDELVRQTVQNETNDSHTGTKFIFRCRKQTPKGSQTHVYVETNQAMAGMMIAVDDHPLTPEQKDAEIKHLTWLESDQEALRKKHAHEKEDSDHTIRIMRALPEAFRYQYAGTENGTQELGHEGIKLVRLTFTPNPAYSPPSRVEQVLTGMEGTLLIDPEAHRIARIDGRLFKEVSFGWGIFGRLDKGSTFRVQQANVGADAWEITEMKLSITGKILLIKSLNMISDEVYTDFRQVPNDTSFTKGVQLLKSEEEKFAEAKTAARTQAAR